VIAWVPPQGRAVDKQLTNKTSLANTGVTTDKFTPLNAVIMSMTVLLYLVIQVSCVRRRSLSTVHLICMQSCIGKRCACRSTRFL